MEMPLWNPPVACNGEDFEGKKPSLRVMNSLTRSKTPFVPAKEGRVLWYMCGPTVYDVSHMGHARTYLHLDILNRIMSDYFNHNIIMVMNITDIDDKIIQRANDKKEDFRQLARRFEVDYMEDMKLLGVKPPSHITRVSEFIPEVIEYIEKIIANGYAYESNGSVYFSVESFHGHGCHHYGKLLPECLGNAALLAEGEGALSRGASDKRGSGDFALWKRSREGEPQWESPWGGGRPGWHIECSVMASKTLEIYGDGTMDIHSGGVDLRFPHHDNEIAQAEAYYDCKQWVNYFLHTGHLHIKGFKMSKSLKNFITIKEALKDHSARQIRLVLLLHKYNDPMDYGDSTMQGALSTEKTLTEYFQNTKCILRAVSADNSLRLDQRDRSLILQIEEAKTTTQAALCDDFDTPAVMKCILQLIKTVNVYIQEKEEAGLKCHPEGIRGAALFVTRMMKVFGVVGSGIEIGFESSEGEGLSREVIVTPVLDVLSSFRAKVRTAARAGDSNAVMTACDTVRDDDLPLLGVRLEDKGDDVVWKLEDPEVLAQERKKKQEDAETKRLEKEAKARLQAEKAAEKATRDRIPPNEWFLNATTDEGGPKYSKFDDDGIPTHSADGEELPKSQIKSLKKEWTRQKTAHEKWLLASSSSQQQETAVVDFSI